MNESPEGQAAASAAALVADDAPLLAPPATAAAVPTPGVPASEAPNADGVVAGPVDVQPGDRPAYIPEKFWDTEKKEPRYEAMAKSYTELEKKLGAAKPVASVVPESYDIKLPEGYEGDLDESELAFFKDAGLSQEQAQKATDYLYTNIIPALHKAVAQVEQSNLAASWQMKADAPEFRERMKSLGEWAYQNLPKEVVTHMSRTATGTQQLWSMMAAGDLSGVQGRVAPQGQASQAELTSMMMDPRYFAGDEAYIKQVEQRAGLAQ